MKNIKRKAFAAVGVAAAVSLALASPSFALNNAKNGKAGRQVYDALRAYLDRGAKP